ncbi:prolyl oligopeptidase family serine peptidase [Pseudoflavitalea sp. G-6-1-2]|uniref:alpha/beta hydrolase family protein n=1 Tax=Pseudoflavitalea sp. G-6-1-2 TaxID=2728841 RepID=UPI00146F1655|nr:prolyl oligopeptidase family serine peptidase [Pseudoflavitalea sp. G-6-1-2]NML19239.1 prolyl oligopeptidase family serine peptidase [Pseudoflavitalea sp. G-6-1-2]
MRKLLLIIGLAIMHGSFAQDGGYKTPPPAMAELLLAKPTPAVSLNNNASLMLLMERNSLPSVEEIAQPELKIAGERINPNNFAPSRQSFINNFILKDIKAGKEFPVTGLPAKMLATGARWSPDEKKIAFVNVTGKAVDLYVIDVATRKATKVNRQPLNALLSDDFVWLNDNTLLYKTILQPASAAPVRSLLPSGPAIQQNLGKVAPSRTYQDMIKSPYDEKLFEFYGTSQLVKNVNGTEIKLGAPAIYLSFEVSPDKNYLLTRTIRKPFSYLVPSDGFNSNISITDLSGKLVKLVAELPSYELSPSGYDNILNAPRGFEWRDDEAATLVWAAPLDSGIYKSKSDFHDIVYSLSAPFTGQPKELFKTSWRFGGITWGNANIALVSERFASKQSQRLSRFNPTSGQLELLYERNTTDAYGFPGSPVTEKNKYGRNVIKLVDNGSKLLLNNTTGSSPKGDLPFLAKFDLATKQSEIIWRCQEGSFEAITDVIDADKLVLLTRRESQKDAPNYFIKNLILRIADQPVTHFGNPYPQLQGVSKQKISYTRKDGVTLTGDLYLPKNYDAAKDGPLPVFMWAYPREFNSAADAAQVRGSKDKFTMISPGGPLFFVTQGYAVLDNAEMPIVATDTSKKPNDNFVDQLQMNAEAAINKLAEMGVGDRNRVAVGGHSYGAFMTANLLAHTNLFRAGIARSGAYNRTLTPFGFQNEERTYWQAPDLYNTMSPFSYADKIKTPLLLIHGEMDDNPGTFPIQSERLFNAVKGHGGTVRFVSLPYEAHGYRGKENLLHMLYEQNAWLEKYVKNASKSTAGAETKKGF